ncbi:heterokaryon incompatibility protein-domain-containing protein [Cubamyces lactineus]|nr:heterokaryon incompatibility protein-domain-containing protein [Cubamyces lactineus]
MRLIDTRTGKFVENLNPDSTCYAILSHVWDAEGEQSYQQVLVICRRVECEGAGFSILDDPELSPKIKGFCAIARDHGYALGWIDSCCIDKTSSAELTEAINSMYQWYRKADVCYAYLADVHDDSSPYRPSERLRQKILSTRWHTRGWTLQELIAPENVLFLTQTWRVIDSKLGLATLLEQATGVSTAVLTGEAAVESVSVACRMSWASRRKTTRIEDEAYSLLGIFGVYMPTIYGEGRNAFLRLQQEIIKTIPDQSIFAWGGQKWPSSPDSLIRDLTRSYRWQQAPQWKPSGLLADSPRRFESAGHDVPVSDAEFASALGGDVRPASLPDIHCSFTPEGAHIQLFWYPLHPMLASRLVAHESSTSRYTPPVRDLLPAGHTFPCDTVHLLALLRCRNRNDGSILARLFGVSDLGPGSILDPIHDRTKLSIRGYATTDYHVLRLLPAYRSRKVEAANVSTRSLLPMRPSSMPLVINPIIDTLPADGQHPNERKWSATSQVQLSPWCGDVLRAMEIKESSRMYRHEFAVSDDSTRVGYQLLLEHQRTVLSSSSLRWVLTSRICVYLTRDFDSYRDISVRHQSVLTGPLRPGNQRYKYSGRPIDLEAAPSIDKDPLVSCTSFRRSMHARCVNCAECYRRLRYIRSPVRKSADEHRPLLRSVVRVLAA